MLGLGALIAMRRGQPARGWIEAGLACDVVDFAVTLLMFRRLPKPGAYAVLATAAAATGIGIYAVRRTGGASDQLVEDRPRTTAAAD